MAKPKPSIAVSDARGVRSLHVGGDASADAKFALVLLYNREGRYADALIRYRSASEAAPTEVTSRSLSKP